VGSVGSVGSVGASWWPVGVGPGVDAGHRRSGSDTNTGVSAVALLWSGLGLGALCCLPALVRDHLGWGKRSSTWDANLILVGGWIAGLAVVAYLFMSADERGPTTSDVSEYGCVNARAC
jgi:hypothetical protein